MAMMKLNICAVIMLTGSAVAAEGFGQTDLTQIAIDPGMFKGGVMDIGEKPNRTTVFCTNCSDRVLLDVILSRSTDGTEERFRTGQTTVQNLEKICKSRDPSCTLKRVEVGPALGWITTYGTNSTVVLFQDGDMLTFRSVSGDAALSLSNARQAIKSIAPQIVGN